MVNDPFEAIANLVRRRIVEGLATGLRRVGAATHGLAVSKPAISRHVRVLEDAGGVVRTSCDCGGPPDPAGTRRSPRSTPGSVAGCGW